jgi:hypothetical protein
VRTYRVVALSTTERRTIHDVLHLAGIGVDAETGDRRESLLRGIADDRGTPLSRARLETALAVLNDLAQRLRAQATPAGWPAPTNEAEERVRGALMVERARQYPMAEAATGVVSRAYRLADPMPDPDDDEA